MATLRTTRSDIRIIGVREVNMPRTPQISTEFKEVSMTAYPQKSGQSKWLILLLVFIVIILMCVITWFSYPLSTIGFIIHLIGYFILGSLLCISIYETGIAQTIKKTFQ